MSTTNININPGANNSPCINQRVKHIANINDDDVTKLQAIGINTTEEHLSFVKFQDLEVTKLGSSNEGNSNALASF